MHLTLIQYNFGIEVRFALTFFFPIIQINAAVELKLVDVQK